MSARKKELTDETTMPRTIRHEQADDDSIQVGADRRNDDTENAPGHDHDDDHADDDSIQNIPGFTEEDERRELATLSMNDIAQVQSDLCGLSSLLSGSCRNLGQQHAFALVGPNLPAAIANLNHEMSQLPGAEASAYYRAVEVCPGQVRPERKLVFLEYAHGNAQEAARALAEYWRGRLDLFGPDRAFRPMTLTGALKEDAMTMAQRQVVQLLPVTDTAGRAILFFSPSRRKFDEYTIEQELQSVWYLFEVVLENASLRKNGVVVICDLRGVQRRHVRRVTRYVRVWQTIDSCLPVDIRGMHCCYPTPAFYYLIFPVVKRLASKSIRLRLKLHYGEDSTVLTNLAGFCLTRDCLPTEFGVSFIYVVVLFTLPIYSRILLNIFLLLCITTFHTYLYVQGDVHLNMNQWMLNRISLEATRRSLEGAGLSSDPALAAASIIGAVAVAPSVSSILPSLLVRKDGVAPGAVHVVGPSSAISSSSTQAIPIPPNSSTKPKEKPPAPKGRASASSKSASDQKPKVIKKRKQKETRGRKPDKQMDLAVQIKLSNPDMSHKDALLAAGYVFQKVEGKTDLVDQHYVSLSQRRNNLCRRIRIGKSKLKREQVQGGSGSDEKATKKGDDGSRQESQDLPDNDESTAVESLLNLMRKPSAV